MNFFVEQMLRMKAITDRYNPPKAVKKTATERIIEYARQCDNHIFRSRDLEKFMRYPNSRLTQMKKDGQVKRIGIGKWKLIHAAY